MRKQDNKVSQIVADPLSAFCCKNRRAVHPAVDGPGRGRLVSLERS
jgi:hypothetical protein